jgi:hypothetical protein
MSRSCSSSSPLSRSLKPTSPTSAYTLYGSHGPGARRALLGRAIGEAPSEARATGVVGVSCEETTFWCPRSTMRTSLNRAAKLAFWRACSATTATKLAITSANSSRTEANCRMATTARAWAGDASLAPFDVTAVPPLVRSVPLSDP